MDNLLNAKEFIMNAKEPGEWFRLADWLKYSAMILEDKIDNLFELHMKAVDKYGEDSDEAVDAFVHWIGVENTFYFLMALAIENIIKGKLIEQDPDKVHFIAKIDPVSGKVLEPIKIDYSWGHNLDDLARRLCNVSKLKLNKKQEIILEHMGELIIWGGRYPAPSSFKVKSKDPFWDIASPDKSVILKLVNKLENLRIKKH